MGPKIRRNTTGSSLQKDGTINPSKGTTIILSHSNNKNKVDAIIYRNEEDMSQTKSSIEVSPSPTIIPDVQDVQQIPTNQMQVDAAAPETQVEEPATEQDQYQISRNALMLYDTIKKLGWSRSSWSHNPCGFICSCRR